MKANLHKINGLLFAVMTIAAIGIFTMASADHHEQKSLYHRLGGYDAIAAVVDDFIQRLATDAQLTRFFQGHSESSLKKIRQLIVDQLCEATGGPCYYTGRDMKTAHAGMKISQADWDASVTHLVATLDKFKVPEAEKNEVLTAISSFKNDIVEEAMPAHEHE
jgi:hemoglobin